MNFTSGRLGLLVEYLGKPELDLKKSGTILIQIIKTFVHYAS